MKGGWVYMMADRYRGAIYIGVTAYIEARAFQHATQVGSDFCRRYGITKLVWAEYAERIDDAIVREKQMKKWRRAWKIELIETVNPDWLDLFETMNGGTEEGAVFPKELR
ncbi:GIY-YIG nuclease family protein [Sphingomonas alpina]|uniref:GIY-YIG nuclease family protein n=1 Tax=Sphingomonas alpina TaxID=653931 RepID=A0A7H0LKE0_9SPHN|nr:GIY-YIG nuclease family protein [Sphingomonas alpina]QNQ10143.1 GIY-YIG nuclease family protein [Sphingomonas alpina]